MKTQEEESSYTFGPVGPAKIGYHTALAEFRVSGQSASMMKQLDRPEMSARTDCCL